MIDKKLIAGDKDFSNFLKYLDECVNLKHLDSVIRNNYDSHNLTAKYFISEYLKNLNIELSEEKREALRIKLEHFYIRPFPKNPLIKI